MSKKCLHSRPWYKIICVPCSFKAVLLTCKHTNLAAYVCQKETVISHVLKPVVLGRQEIRGGSWKVKVAGRLLGAYLEKEATLGKISTKNIFIEVS